jgi:hypothetical protein
MANVEYLSPDVLGSLCKLDDAVLDFLLRHNVMYSKSVSISIPAVLWGRWMRLAYGCKFFNGCIIKKRRTGDNRNLIKIQYDKSKDNDM